MKKDQSIYYTITSRVLYFIPFCLTLIISLIILYFRYVINFVRFGGESIAYTHKHARTTIADVYNKLEELHKENKL